jgi:hypothetical protein
VWKANVYTDKLTVRIIDRDGGLSARPYQPSW